MRHYWRLSSAALLAGAFGVTDTAIAGASPVTDPATLPAGLPAAFQPYMKTVLDSRGTTSAPGSVVSESPNGQSALISDEDGTYVVSVSPIPETTGTVAVNEATNSGLTTWLFQSGSDVPYSSPISRPVGNTEQLQFSGSSSPTSISQSMAIDAGDDTIDDLCTLTVYPVEVVTSPFGPLLNGYEAEVCSFPTNIHLGGQIHQAGLNLKWNAVGPIATDGGSGLELTLTVWNSCPASSDPWPFRLHGWVQAEFGGEYANRSGNSTAHSYAYNCMS